MIYIDHLNEKKYMPSAHLISSLSGCAGRKELIEFAVKVFGIANSSDGGYKSLAQKRNILIFGAGTMKRQLRKARSAYRQESL